ncbi:MAG: hypothetical protein WBP45_01520, partial [Daejeonella sp.]
MKRILFVTALLLIIIISCKKENLETMIVVKDCTGTYLRLNNKDYKVCNFKTVVSFKEGEKVKASFDK